MTDKKAIQNYTDLSRPVTKALWAHHKAGTQPPDEIEGHSLKQLDSITHKSRLSKNMDLHTGIARDPSTLVNKEGHLHLPAYTSASESHAVGKKFALRKSSRHDSYDRKEPAHIITIHAKKGHFAPALGSKSIESHEQERLLPRNTKLKLNPNPDISTDSDGRKIHNWHAEIHSQE